MFTSYSYLTFSHISNKLLVTPQGENCSSHIGGIMSTATEIVVKATLSGEVCTFVSILENPPLDHSQLPDWVREIADPRELFFVCGGSAEQIKTWNRYTKKRKRLNGSTCYLCELKQ